MNTKKTNRCSKKGIDTRTPVRYNIIHKEQMFDKTWEGSICILAIGEFTLKAK